MLTSYIVFNLKMSTVEDNPNIYRNRHYKQINHWEKNGSIHGSVHNYTGRCYGEVFIEPWSLNKRGKQQYKRRKI